MKKLHNNVVQVPLTEDDIWTMLKLFRDGELIKLAPELEQTFINAYHESKIAVTKAQRAAKDLEQAPNIDEMLAVAENLVLADEAILAAWDKYIHAIAEADKIKHYEPLSYKAFANVLKEFVRHYDMSPALDRIARETETLPFEIKIGDWQYENFDSALEEMQEIRAGLSAEEILENSPPLTYRVNAVDLSIKAIEKIREAINAAKTQDPGKLRDAFDHAKYTDELKPIDNLVKLNVTGRSAFLEIRKHVSALYEEFTEDYEHVKESNELELPIGETIQDGKVRGVRSVLALLDELEANFK